jgi:hypothetical protein
MAFGTMSADLFVSSSNRSPEPTVLFYASDGNRAGEEVERLIRTAGFEPVKVGAPAELTRCGRYQPVAGEWPGAPVKSRQTWGGIGGERAAGGRIRAVQVQGVGCAARWPRGEQACHTGFRR